MSLIGNDYLNVVNLRLGINNLLPTSIIIFVTISSFLEIGKLDYIVEVKGDNNEKT